MLFLHQVIPAHRPNSPMLHPQADLPAYGSTNLGSRLYGGESRSESSVLIGVMIEQKEEQEEPKHIHEVPV
jgi:hypothetical protein